MLLRIRSVMSFGCLRRVEREGPVVALHVGVGLAWDGSTHCHLSLLAHRVVRCARRIDRAADRLRARRIAPRERLRITPAHSGKRFPEIEWFQYIAMPPGEVKPCFATSPRSGVDKRTKSPVSGRFDESIHMRLVSVGSACPCPRGPSVSARPVHLCGRRDYGHRILTTVKVRSQDTRALVSMPGGQPRHANRSLGIQDRSADVSPSACAHAVGSKA